MKAQDARREAKTWSSRSKAESQGTSRETQRRKAERGKASDARRQPQDARRQEATRKVRKPHVLMTVASQLVMRRQIAHESMRAYSDCGNAAICSAQPNRSSDSPRMRRSISHEVDNSSSRGILMTVAPLL